MFQKVFDQIFIDAVRLMPYNFFRQDRLNYSLIQR